MTQEKCFGVMRQLGYKLFKDENNLRDFNVQTYDDDESAFGRMAWLK